MACNRIGVLVVGMFIMGIIMGQQDDWERCVPMCKCKWAGGKKAADCKNSGHSTIPSGFSPNIQSVELSGNSFQSLPSEVFRSVGLINLHKLYLKDCGIQEIHKDAFKGLEILIELDLSENRIQILYPGTFKTNFKLREIHINKNPIEKLDDGLFTDLVHLQHIHMSNCQLSHISHKTFINVPALIMLTLDGNNLSNMNLAAVEGLVKLRSLPLHNNPWRCDCHLKEFRDWTIDRNLYVPPTSCAEPLSLQNKQWNEVPSEVFACKPQIIWPASGTSITADDDEVTLSCQVTGNPSPDVSWVFNSRIIANNSWVIYGDPRYSVHSSGNGESMKWVNLTISRVRNQDKGEFTCVATSAGGMEERNITLIVRTVRGTFGGPHSVTDSWPLIIGLVTGLIALLIIVAALCCCFCRRHKRSQGKKVPGNGISPNGDITHHIPASAEQEKSLLTIPNPIQKPPRRYEAQPSPNIVGTELSELNRNLLEDSSVIAGNTGAEEEHQSGESRETTPQLLHSKMETEPYPPDLIAFPARGSPAPLHIHSPVHSPLYHGFGTLPYSRSQSPFSPVAPVVLPRQGYVTIPRRPRVPSWSSAPTPTLVEDPHSPLRAEPVYDNLGPRTTADGSSALSLNKSGIETPRASFEERGGSGILRPLPSPLSAGERRGWRPGDLKRVGSAEIATSTPRSKVAPKPPPKPKKNGPLYEDEGEDGTEV